MNSGLEMEHAVFSSCWGWHGASDLTIYTPGVILNFNNDILSVLENIKNDKFNLQAQFQLDILHHSGNGFFYKNSRQWPPKYFTRSSIVCVEWSGIISFTAYQIWFKYLLTYSWGIGWHFCQNGDRCRLGFWKIVYFRAEFWPGVLCSFSCLGRIKCGGRVWNVLYVCTKFGSYI